MMNVPQLKRDRKSQEWIKHRQYRIGSSVAYRIISRKRNFESLTRQLNQPFKSLNEMSETERRKLSHFESVARDKYYNIMKFRLKKKYYSS